MFIAFAIGLFLTLLFGLKLVAYLVQYHAALGNSKYATNLDMVNIGIALTSAFATATMVFHHFI